MGGLSPSPNQAGGLGHYSSVPIPLSYRALLPFIMNQSSENIVTRSTPITPGAVTKVVRHSGPHSPLCGSEPGDAPSARLGRGREGDGGGVRL